MKPTIKKYPINWQKRPGLEAENKYIPGSLISESSLDNKLAAINLVYFWLENFNESCNYNYPPENNTLNQATKTNSDNKVYVNIYEEMVLFIYFYHYHVFLFFIFRFENPTLSHLFLYPIKSCGRFSVSHWELSSTGLR